MATQAWQAGKLYQPGSLVRPLTAPPVVQSAPTNANFEAGNTGWTLPAGYAIGEFAGGALDGTFSLKWESVGIGALFQNNNAVPVTPGLTITARAYVNQGPASSGNARGAVAVLWFDSMGAFISDSVGNQISSGSDGDWKLSQVTATAPAGAATARIGGFMSSNGNRIQMDLFSWDYAFTNAPDGLIFKAVQADAGFSGSAEPTWPSVLGNTVVDNQVTWEAVLTSRVVYEAHPILKSGATEPTWPTEIGSTVIDNSIIWEAVSRQITDAKCPQSKVVAIAASKIFAADDDIIAFSATVNPLDWSTANDAGYLPFGLNTYGDASVAVLGLYRGNLVAFNAKAFQMWQVDQDPANMAFLDALPIGSTEPRAITPHANDLMFLNPVGIRNVSIAGASTNLQAGGIGQPIDELVKAKIKAAEYTPFALLYPAAGQTWYIFGPEAFVLTVNKTKSASWSRYVFPEAITDHALDGNDLLLRTASHHVWLVSGDALADDVYNQPAAPVLSLEALSGDSLRLTWTASVYPEGDLASYAIFRSVDGGNYQELATVGPAVLTYDDNGINPEVDNSYFVVAVPDETGIQSDASNVVSRTVSELILGVNSTASASNITLQSTDGTSWTGVSQTLNRSFSSVAYSPELGILIASTTIDVAMSSDFGATWSTVSYLGGWKDVAWSSELGLFALVGDAGGAGTISTSPDGVTWTPRTVPAMGSYRAVAWDSRTGFFYAIGNGGTQRCVRSADGVTWAYVTSAGMTGSGAGFAISDSLLLANDGNDFGAWTSADGATWTFQSTGWGGSGASGFVSAYGNGLFAVGNIFNTYRYGSTGTSWAIAATPPTGNRPCGSLGFSASNGLFVAMMQSSADADQKMVATSTDANVWTLRTTPAAADGKTWVKIITFKRFAIEV